MRGKDVDLSANLAAKYRHKAGNMQAIMQAYEWDLSAERAGSVLEEIDQFNALLKETR
jgi:hypothetical protein